jgi:hypothetical protein
LSIWNDASNYGDNHYSYDSEEEQQNHLAHRLLVLEHDLLEIDSDDEEDDGDVAINHVLNLALQQQMRQQQQLIETGHPWSEEEEEDDMQNNDHDYPLNDLDLILMEEEMMNHQMQNWGDMMVMQEDALDEQFIDEEENSWTDYVVNQRYKQALREDDEQECCVRGLCETKPQDFFFVCSLFFFLN